MSTYQQLKASIFAICNKYVIDNNISSIEIFDFDTHTTVTTWPNDTDLLGVGDFSIINLGNMYNINCSIAVCTMANDIGLSRLVSIMGGLFDILQVGEVVGNIVHPISGATLGKIVVSDNVTLLPVGNTNARPYQEIAVQFAVSFQQPPN